MYCIEYTATYVECRFTGSLGQGIHSTEEWLLASTLRLLSNGPVHARSNANMLTIMQWVPGVHVRGFHG